MGSGYARAVIAAYLRVSSRSQDARSQRDAIERAAAARGETVTQWWSEQRSARSTDRPVLSELRAAARRGELRALYVFRLDRLTRSGIRDTLGLLEELRGAGVRVTTVSDGFSLDGPMSEVVIAVMAWAAQQERAALGERIAAARARVEASGGSWGRPQRVTADLERRIRKLRAEKMTIRQIAQRVRVPKSTVAAVLSEKGAYSEAKRTSKKPGLKKTVAPASE